MRTAPPGGRRRAVAAVLLLGLGGAGRVFGQPAANCTAGATVSADGRWKAQFDPLAGELTIAAVDGSTGTELGGTSAVARKRYKAASRDGRGSRAALPQPAQCAEIHALRARRSFVVAFSGLAELWEISTDAAAPPIFEGLVHDHRLGEAIGEPGLLGVRRTRLPAAVHGLGFDDERGLVVARIIGAVPADARKATASRSLLIHLDARRVLRDWMLPAAADTTLARPAERDGRRVLVLPGPSATEDIVLDLWSR